MSGRIDTPLAIPAPLPARRPRAEPGRAGTIWLTEPIDLRVAVAQLEPPDDTATRPDGGGPAPEEIARRLRTPPDKRQR